MRVLVADDKADNAESLCLLLRLWGYEAVCADSGPEALSLAQQFRPEAAIVEMLLPGLGGDEVGRRLRAMPELRRGPLIALSGCAATRRQALEAGFDLVLLKPAEPDDIRGALGPTASPWRSRPFRPLAGYLEQIPAAIRSTMRRPDDPSMNEVTLTHSSVGEPERVAHATQRCLRGVGACLGTSGPPGRGGPLSRRMPCWS